MATPGSSCFSGWQEGKRHIQRRFSGVGSFTRATTNTCCLGLKMIKTYAFSAAVFLSLGLVFLTFA